MRQKTISVFSYESVKLVSGIIILFFILYKCDLIIDLCPFLYFI